ncbi:MAG: hypothetical protein IMZ50_04850 [Candidatus Atribacteria bacterium]|nr:hypothetical protein [Candidatus Atribacteria bacterium]
MGYSYSLNGHLCCDFCGRAGEARKIRCPFGYCPSTATCPECRKKHADKFTRDHHRAYGCEAGHRRFVETEEDRRKILDRGEFLRRAALGHGEKGVKVLFENKDGQVRALWMSHETYDAINLFVPTTPEDYAKHGQVREAETTQLHEAR